METNKKQLIVYVNQTIFGGLLNNGFTMNDNQIAWLGEKKLEVMNDGEINLDLLKSCSIIIKPDQKNFDYTPSCPFKILYHGETQNYSQSNGLNNLKKDKNCEGWKEQPEQIITLYGEIAKLINKIDGHKSFDDIYQSIPKKNKKLEIALEFLHNCLGNNKTIPPLPDEFKNCHSEYNTFQKDRNNQNLRILRDAILKVAGVV